MTYLERLLVIASEGLLVSTVLHLAEDDEEQHAHLSAHGVFMFDSPHAAFQLISAALMLTMFYAALLAMRYARAAVDETATPSTAAVLILGMALPLPLCATLLAKTVADFSYVACLVHPNSELLDEALTQTLETQELKVALREKFIRHFKANGGESIEDVLTLFNKYDVDSNGVLDRTEFKSFMEELFGRRVASKEVEMMFREINIDEDPTIDVEEFQSFLFGSGRFGEAGRYMKDVLSPRPSVGEAKKPKADEVAMAGWRQRKALYAGD